MNSITTCIIVDDEVLAIEHLKKYITKIPSLTFIRGFCDPEEALKFLVENKVDLIFLDIEMPEFYIDGISFLDLAASTNNIILTTAHPEYAFKSYNYNVIDYLLKPFSFERFAKSFQKFEYKNKNINSTRNLIPSPNLTLREIELIKLIEKGLSNKEISTRLFISDKTVAKHVQNIFKKLDVKNRIELLNKVF